MVTVLREFHRYYRYEVGITDADGDAIIIAHILKNYIGWMYEMRQRAAWAVEESHGTTIRDHQPPAVSDAAWAAMCTYWDDAAFKTKSEQVKKN